jgi:hypothetical protein
LLPFGLDDPPAGENRPGRTALGVSYSRGSAEGLRRQGNGTGEDEEAIAEGVEHLFMI